MTSGVFRGMIGQDLRALRRAYLALAALVFGIDAVNVLSTMHDWAAGGHPLPAWMPIVWEYSSGVANLVFATLVYAAMRIAPPQPGHWLRFALVHAPNTVVFSALHVGGMWGLRIAVYALAGLRYHVHLNDFPYEYRKDLVTYAVAAGLFWMFGELERRRSAPVVPTEAPTFDIKDGTRLIRARIDEILAASSAGNYVEFVLVDGRKPLMRTTLAAMEAMLEPLGFVRTHRSWLVNAAKVSGLEAQGSGDFAVRLGREITAPLSRRYPEALRRLRGPNGAA